MLVCLLWPRVKYDLCMILLTNCGQMYSNIGSSLDVADVASDQVYNSYTCYQLIFRLLLQLYIKYTIVTLFKQLPY